MLMRRILKSAAHIRGRTKGLAARAKSYCDRLEAQVSAQRIIVSDVFGADTFVSGNSAPETPERPARWEDGLDFEPQGAARTRESKDADEPVVPAFLTCPTAAPDRDQEFPVAHALRRSLPTLICAGILVVAWISVGRTGPFSQPDPSAADAIAERFSGTDDAPAQLSHVTFDDGARLDFAPRFADLYAELLSKDGVCADGGTIADLQSAPASAASIVIRNLPPGTVLSAGEQMSATAWRLKPDEIETIIVKMPAGHAGPIQANIEKLDSSGSVIGHMAVDVRPTAKDPPLGTARARQTIYRPAGVKVSNKKRVKNDSAQQAAGKATAAGAATQDDAKNPAKQQFSFQLPFLPGPYSKTPPPGATVSQQILINLGVSAEAPTAAAALTQNN